MDDDRTPVGPAPADKIARDQQAPPRKRLLRRMRTRLLLALPLCAIVVAALAGLPKASDIVGNAPPPGAKARAAFVVDEQLAPMLTITGLDGSRVASRYLARAREGAGERWDTLTIGDESGDKPLFRVTLRHGGETRARSSFFVDLARQSAELGAALLRAADPRPDASALGPIEWADMTLADPAGERACVGFRLLRGDASQVSGIAVSGIACGRSGAPIERAGLQCLIGALTPTNAGIQAGLGEVLKGDGARRPSCQRSAA